MVDVTKFRPSDNVEDRSKRRHPGSMIQQERVKLDVARREQANFEENDGYTREDLDDWVAAHEERASGTRYLGDHSGGEPPLTNEHEVEVRPDPNISREAYPGDKNRHLRRPPAKPKSRLGSI